MQDKKQVIAVLTPSVNECNLWVKRIEEAKEEYERTVALAKQSQPSKRSSIVTLFLVSLLFYLSFVLYCLNVFKLRNVVRSLNTTERRP